MVLYHQYAGNGLLYFTLRN